MLALEPVIARTPLRRLAEPEEIAASIFFFSSSGADLVPRGAVESLPTNFAPVKPKSLQERTISGEQVSRLLLAQRLPQLKRKMRLNRVRNSSNDGRAARPTWDKTHRKGQAAVHRLSIGK